MLPKRRTLRRDTCAAAAGKEIGSPRSVCLASALAADGFPPSVPAPYLPHQPLIGDREFACDDAVEENQKGPVC